MGGEGTQVGKKTMSGRGVELERVKTPRVPANSSQCPQQSPVIRLFFQTYLDVPHGSRAVHELLSASDAHPTLEVRGSHSLVVHSSGQRVPEGIEGEGGHALHGGQGTGVGVGEHTELHLRDLVTDHGRGGEGGGA